MSPHSLLRLWCYLFTYVLSKDIGKESTNPHESLSDRRESLEAGVKRRVVGIYSVLYQRLTYHRLHLLFTGHATASYNGSSVVVSTLALFNEVNRH